MYSCLYYTTAGHIGKTLVAIERWAAMTNGTPELMG